MSLVVRMKINPHGRRGALLAPTWLQRIGLRWLIFRGKRGRRLYVWPRNEKYVWIWTKPKGDSEGKR